MSSATKGLQSGAAAPNSGEYRTSAPNGAKIETKRGRGRPAKDAAEKYVTKAFRIPPDVWALVQEFIPEGERSAAVVEGLRRAAVAKRHAREWDQINEECANDPAAQAELDRAVSGGE